MTTREEKIKKISDELQALSDDELDQVAGGTFTPNKYEEPIYNQAGIKTDYSFFKKDKFYAIAEKDGAEISITYDQANWAVEFWKKNNKQASYELIAANCKK